MADQTATIEKQEFGGQPKTTGYAVARQSDPN